MIYITSVFALLISAIYPANAEGQITVNEIRVRDKTGKGVVSDLWEVTREPIERRIDRTDSNGVFSQKFTCPQWHKVVAKPVAGRYTNSAYTSCAPNLVLTVWNVDAFPEASVRIVVPFPAGSTTDLVARIIAQGLEEEWKQKVVVENRPGAGGNIGTTSVASATPDGYTLLMGVSQNFTINPNLFVKLPYNPQLDFSPVTMVAAIPNMLIASPSSPTKSVTDLVAAARANPGKLNFASAGAGSVSHLSIAQFEATTRTTIRHIPFAASNSAMVGLQSGNVDYAFNTLPSVLPNIKSGNIKALAVAGPYRSAALPNVPTMAEAGVTGFDATSWMGIFAPAGTPEQLVRKIQSQVSISLKSQKIGDFFVNQGIDPVGNTSNQFATTIKSDATKWAAVIKQAGVKAE